MSGLRGIKRIATSNKLRVATDAAPQRVILGQLTPWEMAELEAKKGDGEVIDFIMSVYLPVAGSVLLSLITIILFVFVIDVVKGGIR